MGFLINPFIEFPSGAGNFTNVDDLLAYYKFDTTTGGLVNKASDVGSSSEISNGDGSVTGATTVTGLIDNAYNFDGVNDYVEMSGSNTTFKVFSDGSTDWTINYWYKFADSDPNKYMAHNGTVYFGGGKQGYYLFSSPNYNMRFVNNFGSGSDWHMITFTYQISTQTVTLKLDGANTYSVDYSYTEPTQNASFNFQIGKNPSASDQFFDGDQDELSMWGRILTDSEITELYNSGNGLAIDGT